MKKFPRDKINESLAAHQSSLKGDSWPLAGFLPELQTWAKRLVDHFKLDIGTPALCLEILRKNRYGHYRHGRNGFGLSHEIALNLRYWDSRPYWQVLGTLLHELLHAWQEEYGTHGKRNHHNLEFREKAKTVGLIIDKRGHTTYADEPNPFLELLRKELPPEKQPGKVPVKPPVDKKRGKSTLRLWVCQCEPPVKIRVGRSDFSARCNHCQEDFQEGD